MKFMLPDWMVNSSFWAFCKRNGLVMLHCKPCYCGTAMILDGPMEALEELSEKVEKGLDKF